MVRCPKCGADNAKPATRWTGGKGTNKAMTVQRFTCASCGSSYVSWLDSKTGKIVTMTRKKA